MTSPSSQRRRVVITHALRTPIGKYLGSFKELSAADLGTSVVHDLLGRSGVDPTRIGEVILGNGRQAGGGPNVARQVSVRAGIPKETPAYTVNMACGSGLKAIALATDGIQLGRYDIAIAGGTESMSGLPYFLPKMRSGYRLGHAKVVDSMYQDGFMCPLAGILMGATAENLVREFDITREEQDAFAVNSQQKAGRAQKEGRFVDEISAVAVQTRKGEVIVSEDEHLRPGASMQGLAKLPAVFAKENGSVTAGNASGITDGAAAVLIMAAESAEELGLEVLAEVGEYAQVGLDPSSMGLGPVPAFEALKERNGLALDDYDLIELNEAFAAQVIACHRKLDIPNDKLNVNGGSIALGHPIGATGTRIVVTLLHELARRDAEAGLATLCISGGLGFASAFHRSKNG
jgi:acetyl-CoA C-acetyltransferase